MPGKKALAKNEGEVKVLAEKFVDAKGVVIVDYRGMTVEQATKLRNDLRKENVEFKVAKNTLTKIAIKGTDYEGLADYLKTLAFYGVDAIIVSDLSVIDIFIFLLNAYGAEIVRLDNGEDIPMICNWTCHGFETVGYGCFY